MDHITLFRNNIYLLNSHTTRSVALLATLFSDRMTLAITSLLLSICRHLQLLLLLNQFRRLYLCHQLHILVEKTREHKQTVEENRRRENQTYEHSIRVEILLSTVEHPMTCGNLVEELGEVHQQHWKEREKKMKKFYAVKHLNDLEAALNN